MVFGDMVVLGTLGILVGAIVSKLVRDKKKGKACCCTSCAGCSLAGSGCCGAKK